MRELNLLHHWLCRSGRWQRTLRQRVPWVLRGSDLGQNVLELGPGPGLTTGLLRHLTQRLTAIEVDPNLAAALQPRLDGTNVHIVAGDATAMPFPDCEFSASVSFTMLHHVSSTEQDKVLREVWRVTQPGCCFVGTDSLGGFFMQMIHIGDTVVLVDPDTFGARLEAAGFELLEIEKNSDTFRFGARRPAARLRGGGR